jgi:hypothetical protein
MVEKHLKGLKGCFIKKNISQSRILWTEKKNSFKIEVLTFRTKKEKNLNKFVTSKLLGFIM